ncbi:SNF2-related protein [Floccifex sp.]|uniref:DEAD/DEAH box helicase n=1 Tax=Floccifex sp. TaxID=2815810 RepID=UPI003F03C0B0
MQIQMISLRKFVKNSWIYYQASDPYYTGYPMELQIEEKKILYDIRCTFIQGRTKNTVQIQATKEGIVLDFQCDCYEGRMDTGCVHLIACCNLINDINPQSFPFYLDYRKYREEKERQRQEEQRRQMIEAQNKDLMNLVQNTHKNRMAHLIANEDTIYLSMEINGFDYYKYINFSIGTQRKYKIKNIDSVLKTFAQKELYVLGKKNNILLDINKLDEPSQKIYQFMVTYFKEENIKSIYLTEDNIDVFYKLLSEIPQSYYDISIDKQNYEIPVSIQKKKDCYELSLQLDKEIILGNPHLYEFKNNTLIQYPLDAYGQISEFISFAQYERKLWIQEENMKTICQQILLPYQDCFLIKSNFNLHSFEEKIKDIKIYSDLMDNELRIWGDYKVNDQTRHLFDSSTSFDIQAIETIILNYANKTKDNIAYFKTRGSRLNEFLDKGIPLLMQQASVYVSEDLMKLRDRRSLNLNVGIHIQNNLLEMKIDTDDISRDELIQILNAYRKKKKFFKLKNGDTIDLDSQSIQDLDELATQMNLSSKELKKEEILKPAYQTLHLENLDFDIHKDQSIEEYTQKLQELSEVHIDESYQKLLRPYQIEGIQWIAHLNTTGLNGILADDMGLGKTLQVLVYLSTHKNKKPNLIVCPSSLMYNWNNEIEKFHIPMDVICVTGSQGIRESLIQEKHEMYITTYDYLKRDIEFYAKKSFYYVILDEAQYIKNPKTKNAQSVKSLKSEHRLALTGTPIENNLSELWSIFDFLMPGYLYTLPHFVKNYEKPIRVEENTKKQEQLLKLVSPFILRRTKQEVLTDLPDKVEKELWMNFNEQEKNIYVANLSKVNEELQKQFELDQVDSIVILALMTRLRQICCEPRMLYKDMEEMSTKMSVCLDLIETLKENQKKVLLFSSFTTIFDLLIPEFNQREIKYHIITGKTTKEKRRKEVDAFQRDDSDVFLISLKAGGTGLNLTSAQAVIHFDPWWNISAQNQATDRAYRIGQTKNVLVYQLLMKNSIEEKIFEMQQKKKQMSDIFVEGAQGSIASLSKEELKELFTIQG